nr:unnamed protein product [Callosobruchus analis]
MISYDPNQVLLSSELETNNVNKPLFSHVVASKPKYNINSADNDSGVLLIKSETQNAKEVITSVQAKIKPSELNLCINKTRPIKNGMLINCSKNNISRVKEIISDKLGNEYIVKEGTKRNPRIRISGVDPKSANKDTFIAEMFKQTEQLKSTCSNNVKWVFSKKWYNSVDVILEVPPEIRKLLLDLGYAYAGWCRCSVADYYSVTRCFKCSRYGHFHRECSSAHVTCGFDQISSLLSVNRYDIFAVTETWLNKDILSEAVAIDGYEFYRRDRAGRGGGVGFYIPEHNIELYNKKPANTKHRYTKLKNVEKRYEKPRQDVDVCERDLTLEVVTLSIQTEQREENKKCTRSCSTLSEAVGIEQPQENTQNGVIITPQEEIIETSQNSVNPLKVHDQRSRQNKKLLVLGDETAVNCAVYLRKVIGEKIPVEGIVKQI